MNHILMKTKLVIVCMSFFFYSLKAQETEITLRWGKPYKSGDEIGSQVISCPGSLESGFFVLKKNNIRLHLTKYVWVIEKYDHDLRFITSSQFQQIQDNHFFEIESSFQIDTSIYVVASVRSSKSLNNFHLYKVNNSTAELERVDNIFRDLPITRAVISLSPDSSMALLAAQIKTGIDENERYHFFVIGKGTGLLWEKELTLPYQKTNFKKNAQTHFCMDNDQNIYSLGMVYQGEITSKTKEKDVRYDYYLVKSSGNASTSVKCKLATEGMYINTCRLDVDQRSKMFVAGFYSDRNDLSRIGSFIIRMNDAFNEVATCSTNEMPLEYLTKSYLAPGRKRIQNDITSRFEKYAINTILKDESGRIVLCAQEHVLEVHNDGIIDANASHTHQKPVNLYSDILLFSIDAENRIQWVHRVPKDQRSIDKYDASAWGRNTDYWGYIASLTGDKVVLLFNDTKKNLNVTENGKASPIANKTAKLTCVAFDAHGNYTRTLVPVKSTITDILRYGSINSTNKIVFTRRNLKGYTPGVITINPVP